MATEQMTVSVGTRSSDSVTASSVSGPVGGIYTVTLSAAVPGTTVVGDSFTDNATNTYLITAISGSDLSVKENPFNPGTAPTTGAGSTQRAYSTIQLAENDIPADISTASAEEKWDIEVYDDGGGAYAAVDFSTHTSDSSNYITLTAADGDSFRDNTITALRYDTSQGVCIFSSSATPLSFSGACHYHVVSRLMIKGTYLYGRTISDSADHNGGKIENCVIENGAGNEGVAYRGGTPNRLFYDCVFYDTTASQNIIRRTNGSATFIFCTIARDDQQSIAGTGIANTTGSSNELRSCLVLNCTNAVADTSHYTNSSHNGTDASGTGVPGSDSESVTYTDEIEDPDSDGAGTYDMRTKSTATAVGEGDGSGDTGTVSDDIQGTTRATGSPPNGPTIGAWEVSAGGGGSAALVGTAIGTGLAVGSLKVEAHLAGPAVGIGVLAGPLTATHFLAGTAIGTGKAIGSLLPTAPLSGAAIGTGVADATTLNLAAHLAGPATGTGLAVASLTVDAHLAGAAVGEGKAVGPLTAPPVPGAGSVVGAAVGTGRASASLTVSAPLAGTAIGTGLAVGAEPNQYPSDADQIDSGGNWLTFTTFTDCDGAVLRAPRTTILHGVGLRNAELGNADRLDPDRFRLRSERSGRLPTLGQIHNIFAFTGRGLDAPCPRKVRVHYQPSTSPGRITSDTTTRTDCDGASLIPGTRFVYHSADSKLNSGLKTVASDQDRHWTVHMPDSTLRVGTVLNLYSVVPRACHVGCARRVRVHYEPVVEMAVARSI